MVLVNHAVHSSIFMRLRRRCQDGCQIDTFHLPVIDRCISFEHINAADHFIHRAETKLRHVFTHFLCHHEQIVDHVFRLAAEFLAQLGVLRGNTDRAGIQVTLSHHDAAQCNQWCR